MRCFKQGVEQLCLPKTAHWLLCGEQTAERGEWRRGGQSGLEGAEGGGERGASVEREGRGQAAWTVGRKWQHSLMVWMEGFPTQL